MTEPFMALSSKVAPAKLVKIDGEEYELFGTDHLTPNDEAEVMALFSRHSALQNELAITSNVAAGTAVAQKVRKARIAILAKLTTIPRAQLDKYPTGLHVALLEGIQTEIDAEADLDLTDEEGETADSGL